MAKLGFIGLGVMGGNMVARLLEKGHSVTGYNRTRSKAQWLIDKGMKFADSPRAVAEASDVTFTMVTNAAALGAVTEGPNGLLRGVSTGKFHIDMSTVSPEISRALAAKVREKGADMIDAPVSGSVITLQQGKLSVMVGGRKETFEQLKPLLLDIGPKVTHVGDNGVALAMKIALNSAARSADAGIFGGRAAGGKERHFARGCGGRDGAQRDRLAHDSVPRSIRAAATGRSVVRRQHDAERHAAGDGNGPQTERAGSHDGGQQRVPHRGARHGLGEAGFRRVCSMCWHACRESEK